MKGVIQNMIIAGKRCSGKTYQALFYSHLKQVPILVMNMSQAKLLENQAKDLGLEIPKVIVLNSEKSLYGLRNRKIIIDDAELFLKNMLTEYGLELDLATFTYDVESKLSPKIESKYEQMKKYDLVKQYLYC